jgi:multiple sugar transport system substrate-binding protein
MKIRILTAGVVTLTLASTLVACSGGSGGSAGAGSTGGTTITYWATNQAASVDADTKILTPEIAKFEKQTGIKVNLQVVPWTSLTPNTLAAAVSGQGPDVVNIGNTNAVTFQSTGAFYPFDDKALQTLGGKDRFVASALATAGAAGQVPTSIPLYSQVYGLYYNKKLFADAGIKPPTTWEELISAAQALTKPDQHKYGISIPGGTVNLSMHFSFIFGAQNGGSPFDKAGNPTFTSPGMVKGVKQYVDLLSKYHVVNPSDAQYTVGAEPDADFARGDAAMFMAQTSASAVLKEDGMDPNAYGVVPIPAPMGGDKIGSFIAGTNISIFKNSKNIDAALKFVKFMTSDKEQTIMNTAYTSLPVVKGAVAKFTNDQEKITTWTTILAEYAKPMALVPGVQAFQTNVGGAVVKLIASAATGSAITDADVRAALQGAQQKMGATK